MTLSQHLKDVSEGLDGVVVGTVPDLRRGRTIGEEGGEEVGGGVRARAPLCLTRKILGRQRAKVAMLVPQILIHMGRRRADGGECPRGGG